MIDEDDLKGFREGEKPEWQAEEEKMGRIYNEWEDTQEQKFAPEIDASECGMHPECYKPNCNPTVCPHKQRFIRACDANERMTELEELADFENEAYRKLCKG